MTVAEWAAKKTPKIEYLVKGVVPAGLHGIMSAPEKSLKTHLSLDLVVSMATATPFLDRFKVPKPVRAGYVSNESDEPKVREAFDRITAHHGTTVHELKNTFLDFNPIFLPRNISEVELFITENRLQFLVLDPTSKILCESSENSTNQMGMYHNLGPISDVGQKTGCSIMLVNHSVKVRHKSKGPYSPPERSEISGAGFAGWMRWWILLHPRQPFNGLTGEHRLWMRAEGSSGHSRSWAIDVSEGPAIEGDDDDDGVGAGRTHWMPTKVVDESEVHAFTKPRTTPLKKDKTAERRAEITRVLSDSAAKTRNAISTSLNMGGGLCSEVIEGMISAGLLEECPIPGSKKSGVRLMPSAANETRQSDKAA